METKMKLKIPFQIFFFEKHEIKDLPSCCTAIVENESDYIFW